MTSLLPLWLCRFIFLNKCHVYNAEFLSKSSVCNSSNKKFNHSFVTFMHMPNLYSYIAASFKSLFWKTVGEAAETSTLLSHVYKENCLSKSRVCISGNENLISFVIFIRMLSLYSKFQIHYENMPMKYTEKKKKKKKKKWKFSDKNSCIFHNSAQNIDCGHSLEPPRRGGSNEYPQSMFWAEIRKIMYIPVNPSFTI